MIELTRLNKLEETMTSLAAYLMIADKKHPKQILGETDAPGLESIPTAKLRLTQHYVQALLAYGVPPTAPELRRVIDAFATPFPQNDHDDIDQIEMTRLEGLLNLRPDDPTVQPRLHQLMEQRLDNGMFEIARDDGGEPRYVFDTLWTIKILSMARQRGVLNGLIDDQTIQDTLDQIIATGLHDKDLALALRLRHDMCHSITSDQVTYVDGLVQQCRTYGHLWGIKRDSQWKRVQQMIQAMHNRQLTSGLISERERDFRNIILNTCYVVENLAEIAHIHPELQTAIQQAVELWWRQFEGDNAPSILRAFFADEYDFLMVTCRTMVAISAWVGEPLGAQLWLRPLREMSQRFSTDDWPEKISIENALRNWIGIELGEPAQLKLGLSEANVIRISPEIYNPTEDTRINLLRGESLVVKYGPVEDIDKERRNYNQLPARLRSYFVKIPEREAYLNEERQGFVVMEDLRDYFTLFEMYDRLLKPDNPRLPALLSDFLLTVHRGEGGPLRKATSNHLRDIYIVPMLRHVDEMLKHVDTLHHHELIGSERYAQFEEVESALNRYIARVMQAEDQLKQFSLTPMHGDLHSRNIMIKVMEEQGRSWNNSDLDFKLIDLESLRLDGDAAHDAGQLLVDLNLLRFTGKKDVSRSIYNKLVRLQEHIEAAYLDFAREHDDTSFRMRLDLAKARALIRVAKGMSKRAEQNLRNREDQQATNIITRAMELAEDAIENLAAVDEALKH